MLGIDTEGGCGDNGEAIAALSVWSSVHDLQAKVWI